jgi:hypothetical protein
MRIAARQNLAVLQAQVIRDLALLDSERDAVSGEPALTFGEFVRRIYRPGP